MTTRLALFSLIATFATAALFLPDAQAAKEQFDRSKPHVNVAASSADLDLSGFNQMHGLGVEIESLEDPTAPERKRPGRTTYSDITLKRAYKGATDVQEWATGGGLPLRDITIHLITRSAKPVARFELIECFPTSWRLDTDDDGDTIESIVLRVNRIEFAKG